MLNSKNKFTLQKQIKTFKQDCQVDVSTTSRRLFQDGVHAKSRATTLVKPY